MSDFKFIEGGWESYHERVMLPDASEVQVTECRQAYYAGAANLFTIIVRGVSPGDEPTDADMYFMESIQAEINEFGQELDLKLRPVEGHG